MQFTKAIVRTPCLKIAQGLSSADLGKPDYQLALQQHNEYIMALRECGLNVRILAPDHDFPDSTFVEDTALLTSECAVITNPGAMSRKGEVVSMEKVIKEYFEHIHHIEEPGSLEAGDVMMASRHFFVGLSERTNAEGAQQLAKQLEKYDMQVSPVEIGEMLHLKSGVSYLENNMLLAVESMQEHDAFKFFDIISVPEDESYAANSLWINDTVLVPEGYPVTLRKIQAAGYKTIVLNMSEFRKLDGGLSCLSLRF